MKKFMKKIREDEKVSILGIIDYFYLEKSERKKLKWIINMMCLYDY